MGEEAEVACVIEGTCEGQGCNVGVIKHQGRESEASTVYWAADESA